MDTGLFALVDAVFDQVEAETTDRVESVGETGVTSGKWTPLQVGVAVGSFGFLALSGVAFWGQLAMDVLASK